MSLTGDSRTGPGAILSIMRRGHVRGPPLMGVTKTLGLQPRECVTARLGATLGRREAGVRCG